MQSHLVVAFTALGGGAGAPSADGRAKAEQLLNRYIALEAAFDPAVADLYADDAVIRNRRTYPTGEVREATVPAAQYKAWIARRSRSPRRRTTSAAIPAVSTRRRRARADCRAPASRR
jgi:hypothetical protein